ncbi:glycoside hydrolase family 3 C-terminal domain-containing protein [Monashia sp. NPDC004114]
MTDLVPSIHTSAPEEVVAALTLEEKASLTSGASFWFTKSLERVGIPEVMLTDGPHGVRKQRVGGDQVSLADSVPATCFPPAVGLGSTFDPELLERVGAALGDEAVAEEVGVLLGPGINIKRSPLCGRNFEYFSEDPFVSGVLGAALVRGLQSRGVGASVKHFAANNQETDRMRVSADVDERPLREIYLRGFQRVVTEARPWTVMCSYNRINGTYASENPWLLTEVLRDEWGYEGLVMSDWGAVNDRVAGLAAGLDLEMPSSGGRTDAEIVGAVRAGELDESVLDRAAVRVVDLVQKALTRDGRLATAESSTRSTSSGSGDDWDMDRHHALAREAAGRSVVLLKNDGDLLPLSPSQSVAVIGAFATEPRYQGAGSSLINPTRLDRALDGLTGYAGEAQVGYAAGFVLGGLSESRSSEALVEEAVALAASKDVAVVFLGLPAELESEGYDRDDIDLPADQITLLSAVVEANPRTVVVLSNGGVLRLGEVADRAAAVLEGWLLGQAGGSAVADVLYGTVNPSARLTETVPHRLQDSPAYLAFPGEHGHVRYGEGIFVGYRWYDARDVDVQYPFGHGLSYTTFDYSSLSVRQTDAELTVRLTLTNSGTRDGREVVQVYVGLPDSTVTRAPKELKGFASVDVPAGESREVQVHVPRADLAYWNTQVGAWVVEGGAYAVHVGASSRDLRLHGSVEVVGDRIAVPLTVDSSVAEILADPQAAEVVRAALTGGGTTGETGQPGPAFLLDDPEMRPLLDNAPIGRIAGFPGSPSTPAEVGAVLRDLNSARGIG